MFPQKLINRLLFPLMWDQSDFICKETFIKHELHEKSFFITPLIVYSLNIHYRNQTLITLCIYKISRHIFYNSLQTLSALSLVAQQFVVPLQSK